MGKEYHEKVNRDIAKYGVKDPAQSESFASEPDNVINNRNNRDGIYWKRDEIWFSRWEETVTKDKHGS